MLPNYPPPPDYQSTTMDDDTLVPSRASTQEVKSDPDAHPPHGGPLYQHRPPPLPAVPSSLSLATQLPTPYVTAPNTPFVAPGPYGGVYHHQPQQQFTFAPQAGMYPMQPMYPSPPGGPVQPQQMNPTAPINVVVNTNANAGSPLISGGPNRPLICPKCRKGIIVRQPSKVGKAIIKFIAVITCCCLCCLPCLCLRRNYVDMCGACGKNYGHRGSKKRKSTV